MFTSFRWPPAINFVVQVQILKGAIERSSDRRGSSRRRISSSEAAGNVARRFRVTRSRVLPSRNPPRNANDSSQMPMNTERRHDACGLIAPD